MNGKGLVRKKRKLLRGSQRVEKLEVKRRKVAGRRKERSNPPNERRF
jgi:hypothetical protein